VDEVLAKHLSDEPEEGQSNEKPVCSVSARIGCHLRGQADTVRRVSALKLRPAVKDIFRYFRTKNVDYRNDTYYQQEGDRERA
jgi:hypothetical protein